MNKELKHLAPYGEDCQVLNEISGKVCSVGGLSYMQNQVWLKEEKQWVNIENLKLIAHPLSDLTKEIEHNGKKFVPIIELGFEIDALWVRLLLSDKLNIEDCKYSTIIALLEWHFDVFGLIESGLAISYNDINPKEL